MLLENEDKVCSYMETYMQTYTPNIEKFFRIYPLLKCYLKSDAETNKITNSACLSWVKLRTGRHVTISVLQNK